jgi:hypothetical protein
MAPSSEYRKPFKLIEKKILAYIYFKIPVMGPCKYFVPLSVSIFFFKYCTIIRKMKLNETCRYVMRRTLYSRFYLYLICTAGSIFSKAHPHNSLLMSSQRSIARIVSQTQLIRFRKWKMGALLKGGSELLGMWAIHLYMFLLFTTWPSTATSAGWLILFSPLCCVFSSVELCTNFSIKLFPS